MKKFLTTFLFVCSCALVSAAVGCDDNEGGSSESTVVLGEERSVSFEAGEGYDFESNVVDGVLRENATLTFKLDLGAFYTDTAATTYVNDKIIAPNDKGEYKFTVGEEDINVRVEGVRKDVSNMSGSGAFDDAFVVSKPIDLIYIAEQVNSGNTAYVQGSYVLANDIDLKGEELKIIGDRSTERSIFSGSFVAEANEDGVRKHSISNFVINSSDANYVGLFGAVFADMSLTSSGVFYGISLENFEINANVSGLADDNKSISCGGLMGYGVGTNLFLCDAKNGVININADQNYFSFAGGLMGYQQGFYESNYNEFYPAEIAYAEVSTDVNVLSGVALYAGGITGYMATNFPYAATASVHNSYSTGSVTGAIRSGGIAGGMGQYSVVSNCYATGEITARAYQKLNSAITATDEYCYSYAGGLVGFAENDTIAHDSFFSGTVSASAVAGSAYALTDDAIAGGDAEGFVSVDAQKYIVLNCFSFSSPNGGVNYTKKLGWQQYDWVFENDKFPVINYDSPEGTITLSLKVEYKAPHDADTTVKVEGATSKSLKFFDTSIQSISSYNSIGSYMASEGLPLYQTADNGYRSYGYFFDEACTQKVPYSYLPTKEFTMYVGFIDVTPIVGEYQLLTENDTEKLTIAFDKLGVATYSDGATTSTTTYLYNGSYILVEMARLARYYQGDVVADEEDTTVFYDTKFDLNRYAFYNFMGIPSTDGISFYDGKYFTESDPLVAKKALLRGEYYIAYSNETQYFTFYGDRAVVETLTSNNRLLYAEYDGVTITEDNLLLTDSKNVYETLSLTLDDLTSYDKFKGSWTKSATVDKTYTFDGIDSWQYVYTSYDRNGKTADEKILERAYGTYEIIDNFLVFTHNDVEYSASFNSDGFLEIVGGDETHLFHAENSFEGTWRGTGYDLVLKGIRQNGTGTAILVDESGFEREYIYENSETDGILVLYGATKGVKEALYGYLIYDKTQNTMRFVSVNADAESGYAEETLYLYDDYLGDWVGDHAELQGVEFSFNGLGLYAYVNGIDGELTVTENGVDTVVDYSVDSALIGKFSYKGKTYQIAYDEVAETILVTLATETSLERKDELANIDFIDMDGVRYAFDGKSSIHGGGTLTVDGKTTYSYYPNESGFEIFTTNGGPSVGSLVKGNNHYLLTLDGNATQLYIANEFMGDWAISDGYALFQIEPTDLNGVIHAKYKGNNVELTFIEPTMLTFNYREDKMPITYYVYVIYDEVIEENVLVLSEFTNLLAGDYIICTKANDFYGTWEWNRDGGKTTLRFDGVSSSYANGNAVLTLDLNYSFVATDYYYSVRKKGTVMWSTEPLAGSTVYFSLEVVPQDQTAEAAKEKDVFVQRNQSGEIVKVLRRVSVDGLYLTEAKDEDGATYVFDGKGNLIVDDVITYTYKIKSFNMDNTATLEVTDNNGVTYSATLNYQDQDNYLFILGERLVEEQA